jgi:hypothetical protein
MNVLLDDMIAANPVEVVPVSHLVFDFGPVRLAINDPRRGTVPIGSGGD